MPHAGPGSETARGGCTSIKGYRRHLRPSGPRIEQATGRSARRNRPQPLRDRRSGSDRGSCGNCRRRIIGGAEGSRTPDPKTASLVLSQLSYSPTREVTLQGGAECCQGMVPGAGFEPARPYGHPILNRTRMPGFATPAPHVTAVLYSHPTLGRPVGRSGL